MQLYPAQENSNTTILVVDDDSSMRMLLRLALEQEGYQVIEVADGQACLEAYQQYRPQAVLLDAVMPVMDGFNCCKQLQGLPESDRTPIVMITVLDDQDAVEQAFTVGASDYVTKPVHWTVLRYRLRRLLQHAQLYVQLGEAKQEQKRLASILAQYEQKQA